MNDFFDNIDDVNVSKTEICVNDSYRWELRLNFRKNIIAETFGSIDIYEKALNMSLENLVLKDSDVFYKTETEDNEDYMWQSYTTHIFFGGKFNSEKDVIRFIDATNVFKSTKIKNLRYPYNFSIGGKDYVISGLFCSKGLFNMHTWCDMSTDLANAELHNIASICSICLDNKPVSVIECGYIMNCLYDSWITLCRDYCMSIFTKVPAEYNVPAGGWDTFEVYHGGSYFFTKNNIVKQKIADLLSKARKVSEKGIKKLMYGKSDGIQKGIGVFNLQNMKIGTQNDCQTERHFEIYEPSDPEFEYIEFIEEFIRQSSLLSKKTYRDIPFINKISVKGNDVIVICCVGTMYRKEVNATYIGYIGLKGNVDKVLKTLKSIFLV